MPRLGNITLAKKVKESAGLNSLSSKSMCRISEPAKMAKAIVAVIPKKKKTRGTLCQTFNVERIFPI